MILGINSEKKVYFRSKSEKNEHHYWVLHVEISLSSNFQLKVTVSLFWTKFAHTKGSYFQSEIDTTIEQHHWILHIRYLLSLCIKFHVEQFWIFGPNLFKLCSKTEKSRHHHWISHVQISLGTKFQLELTILISLTRFAQKGIFSQKQKKSTWNSTYLN